MDAHISGYPEANRLNHDPLRTRKLLLHKREIRRLIGKVEQRGYTLIPLKLYFVNGNVKVDLGLAKGKKLYDKRETLRKKTMDKMRKSSIVNLPNWPGVPPLFKLPRHIPFR